RKRGTNRFYVYTYPARKALRAVMGKVKTLCRQMDTNQPLDVLLRRLNPVLRGWCAHFRPGVSSATFAYLSAYTWARVIGWLRRKHRRITLKELRRRYCAGGWWPSTTERALFNPAKVRTTRYPGHDRGSSRFPGRGRIQRVQDQGSRPPAVTATRAPGTLVVIRRLINQARSRSRRPTRPTTRRLR
ncbi:MAG TPA: group II intron maturase-specific domain-containing protein, partial [Umezawaea sp.]|nr:group II intron maturase-specific domain-containing protein [Umezawaea sp.]